MGPIVVGATLCAAVLVGCTGGGPSKTPQSAGNRPVTQSTSQSPTSFRSSDVALVVAYGIGAGTPHALALRPRKLAERVHARDCVAWLDPRFRGAAGYEVHLRVRRTDALNARRALFAIVGGPAPILVGAKGSGGGSRVRVTRLSAFDTPPTNMGPRPLQQTC